MIIREKQLSQLITYKSSHIVKVITGIRRCGKSFLLQQFFNHLLQEGVPPGNIHLINFESLQYEHLKDYKSLYSYINDKLQAGKNYILLDEIQEVTGWEKAIASFQVDLDCDITLTGSNAFLLSSDLSTYIAGRYVEIHLLPLSFKEYQGNFNEEPQALFRRYLRFGGFPGLLELPIHDEAARNFLDGIFNTIVVKDIIARNNFRDVDLLEAILAFMFDNIGNLVSANNIANYLSSNGRLTSSRTVVDYLEAMQRAFILYKAARYNLKGKRILNSPHKYYLADIGLRNALLGFRDFDLGYVLENIVFLELIRRGYDIRVGVNDSQEVDFVATKDEEKVYFQVALSLADERVLARELKSLLSINDNYPKFLLSMDYHIEEQIQGIKLLNIIDFLLA